MLDACAAGCFLNCVFLPCMKMLMNRILKRKKHAFFLVFVFFVNEAKLLANPGDTTWVTVWNQRKLTQSGNYDTTAVYPTGKRFRKIRLHYILGRYKCPGNPQYCGSWDYTTQIYAKPTGMDTVEVARVITPYATDWLSLNKKHDYIIDITDYAPVLSGSTGMRFNYSGYSWGFTITLKIEFIEGVPPMDALSIKNVYDGYYAYGNPTLSIENYLTAKTFSYGATTGKVFLKNSVSGHGSDANYCSEFCEKYYKLNVNGSQVAQKQIWRKDCGFNEVYPQTGTWIYERANWCPGAVVWPIYHDLSALTSANTNFTVDVDMETYTVTSPSAGYNWVSQLVQYSAPNHTLDVSLEDIIAPTSDDNYLRENPACMNPMVKIKNVGTSPVGSVAFSYGLLNGTVYTHTWTGVLNFLEETTVTFPPTATIMSGPSAATFTVKVVSVNGSNDQNALNDTYDSKTLPVSYFPGDFVIKMVTNSSTDTITNKNESSWKLYNESGAMIASRTLLNNNTVYLDTLSNLPAGCYKFVVSDSGCDGLGWWANPGAGNGSIRFDYNGFNSTIFYFPIDIGCGYTKYFVVPANLTGLSNMGNAGDIVEVYPNPSSGQVLLKTDLSESRELTYAVFDISGRLLHEKKLPARTIAIETIDMSGFKDGVYVIRVNTGNGAIQNFKLVLAR